MPLRSKITSWFLSSRLSAASIVLAVASAHASGPGATTSGPGGTAFGPSATAAEQARERYHAERAICIGGLSHQPREVCLREAAAAYGAALKGDLDDPLGHLSDSQQRYQENRLRRCDVLPAEDRDLCRARMRGEGVTRGSVEEGGIYRELTVIERLPAP